MRKQPALHGAGSVAVRRLRTLGEGWVEGQKKSTGKSWVWGGRETNKKSLLHMVRTCLAVPLPHSSLHKDA